MVAAFAPSRSPLVELIDRVGFDYTKAFTILKLDSAASPIFRSHGTSHRK
jgi:hypothetical protein